MKNYANLPILKFSVLWELYVIFSNEGKETTILSSFKDSVAGSEGQSRKSSEWVKSKNV